MISPLTSQNYRPHSSSNCLCILSGAFLMYLTETFSPKEHIEPTVFTCTLRILLADQRLCSTVQCASDRSQPTDRPTLWLSELTLHMSRDLNHLDRIAANDFKVGTGRSSSVYASAASNCPLRFGKPSCENSRSSPTKCFSPTVPSAKEDGP